MNRMMDEEMEWLHRGKGREAASEKGKILGSINFKPATIFFFLKFVLNT